MNKLLLLLLLTSFASFAQKREKGTIEVVPILGRSTFFYATYDLFGDDYSSNSYKSVNFGIDGDYYFNNRWSLRSGLLFQTMGAQIIYPIGEQKLNYLNIPVNANWHFGSTRKWNLNFGLTPGFLLSAKGDYSTGEVDLKDSLHSFQLGLTFGIGYKIAISDKFSILIDYQAFAGLTNINKKMQDAPDLFNNGSSYNIGGVFHFK